MRINNKAQSVIEYVTIIAFVMVGIVLGGEYAMRAMSGGIMNLTRSEETSRKELLGQGPTDPGIQIPGCNCTDWSPPVCGGGSCNQRQMYTSRTCVGAGCSSNFEFQCTYDESCCSDPQLVTPSPDGCGAHSSPPCTTNYGEGWACWQCGNLPIQCGCKPFNECRFRCGLDTSTHIQNNPVPNSLVCPLDDLNIFYNNLPWTLDGNDPTACSSPAGSDPKCQTYCRPGTIKQGNECVGCPQPVVVAHPTCHCKSNSSCHCACNSTPINVDAICPQGTTAESGFCVFYNLGYGDAGFQWGVAHSYINGLGESVWRCPNMQAEYHGQSTCRATGVVAFAFCQPPAPCYRSVLVDLTHTFQVQCETLDPIIQTGGQYLGTKRYATVGVFHNIYRCALIDNYLPIPASPTCHQRTVMGDAQIHGYGAPGVAQWPNPIQNTLSATPYSGQIPNRPPMNQWEVCGSAPCCSNDTYILHPNPPVRILPRYYGCPPPGWKIEGYDRYQVSMHVLREETNFCAPTGSCPAGSRPQVVVEDAYMKFQPTAGPPSYTFPSCDPGYGSYGNIGIPSRMQHCKKMTTICVAD